MTALTTTLTASATLAARWWRCSPDATFLGFSDALDKTTFEGQPVAGLSAINVTGSHSAVALVDNVGTTPARVFDLEGEQPADPAASRRDDDPASGPDGTPYTGGDFDGEGLVVERGEPDDPGDLGAGAVDPALPLVGRLADSARCRVPARFQVAPGR